MASPTSYLRSVVDANGAVVLDVEHDVIVTLNSTGGYIWERLQRQDSLDDIVRDLVSETEADTAVVDGDVHAFVEQLEARGLLGQRG